MIKGAFKLIAAFWILSPAAFLILRTAGVYNFPCDIAVFMALMLMSSTTMFLTYKSWD